MVSGFIAIIGRPNVGKSTFLNRVLGYKVSITTKKTQTTRDRILGIWDTHDAQVIFLDTPGVHLADKALNKYMVQKAVATMGQADLVMLMVEPDDTKETLSVIYDYLKEANKTTILVLNKIDFMDQGDITIKIEELNKCYNFTSSFGISSVTGKGIDKLMDHIKTLLPEGPKYFPEDMVTDMPVRFLCQEIIREKVFTLTRKEIPYAAAVVIEEFREGIPTFIRGVVHVEKSSQRAIIIGKNGSMLKEIGIQARVDIEELLGNKVFLELFVKVTKNWTKDPLKVKRMGYQ
ncbi:MAG: GTPase Era [Thermodesulfobacteriota bacterium]|nr:GTPase Era [Thermodesulfobacteriota bacterium]